MIKKFLKYTVSVAVITSMIQVTPAFAAPPVTQGQLHSAQQRVEDFETRVQILDDKISNSMTKSEELSGQIKTMQEKVKGTEAEIKTAKEDLEVHKAVYAERLKSIQLEGKQSIAVYAELLLSSDDLSQFFTRFTAISQVLQSDSDLLNGLKEKEQALKTAQEKLQNELDSLQKAKDELTALQQSIEKDKQEIQTALAAAKDDFANLQTQYNEEQEAKRQAELARRAQEEAEKAAQQQTQQAAQPAQQASQEQHQVRQQPASTNNDTKSSKPAPAPKPAPAKKVTSSGSASAGSVISIAKQYLGVPYVWGGTTPRGFDCSGFVQYVYRQAGVSLPRVSRDQQRVGTSVPLSQVQPGDLVFRGNPAYHVGIYIGGGKYIHAPQTGDVVKIATFNPSKFTNAKRVR
ncbi:C40 family peptidase [Neobacillus mesonae]|uniref:C40 family peptidase n=1 Tax=Neobacillus mesonae TaxID=1193713 RepID=UPI00203E0BEC|nr:C40 family peptidase [Neobacillus mesonae]MCM3569504.1 NlpC/P60 family protein [Neobacillus mesonae]